MPAEARPSQPDVPPPAVAGNPRAAVLQLPDAAATDRLGVVLAGLLRRGDTVLLSGPIGAGKTHLARAVIRARAGAGIEVPSPSFTLVQTYEAPGDDPAVWHADLYRLTHPDEVAELGLWDAFASAICLVEWPDRLGRGAPSDALRIDLTAVGEGRAAAISGGRPGLVAAIADGWPAA